MTATVKIASRRFSVFYGTTRALHGITLDVLAHQILGIIGPVRVIEEWGMVNG